MESGCTFSHQGYVIFNANPVGKKFLEYAKTFTSPDLMDVGCGNGYPVAIPAIQGGAKFMCADGMQQRIDQLKKGADELGISEESYKTVVGFYPGTDPELVTYGGHNKYDAVFTARTIHIGDVENFMACLRAIFSQLRAGGKLFLETTPAEAAFYQIRPKLKSDYQER